MRLPFLFTVILFASPVSILPGQAREYVKRYPTFTEIEISGAVSSTVVRGGDSVSVSVKNGSIDDIDIQVYGSVLSIRKKGSFITSRDFELEISASGKIGEIRASSGAIVKSFTGLMNEVFHLRADSGAVIDIYADSEKAYVRSGRNSTVRLRGKCLQLDARAEHGGAVEASETESARVYAYAYTGGRVEVNATEFLEAAAGLGSEVRYRKSGAEKMFSETLGGKYSED